MEGHQVVLLIGGNLGDRLSYLTQAVERLQMYFQLLKKSEIYETEAWGGHSTGNYLNQALLMNSVHSASQVLDIVQGIERQLARERKVRWGNRTMDIDIIYYDDLILNTPLLQIPHPLLQERRFVLRPLVEIIPEYIHPEFKVNQLILLDRLKDSSSVIKMNQRVAK